MKVMGRTFTVLAGGWYIALNKFLRLVEWVFGWLGHESHSESCLPGGVCGKVMLERKKAHG